MRRCTSDGRPHSHVKMVKCDAAFCPAIASSQHLMNCSWKSVLAKKDLTFGVMIVAYLSTDLKEHAMSHNSANMQDWVIK